MNRPCSFWAMSSYPTDIHLSSRRQHHDPRTDRRALVEVDDILVDHADAARGNAPADGPRFIRAMDTVERILVALPEVHGTRTERIAWAAGPPEAALQFAHLPPPRGLA